MQKLKRVECNAVCRAEKYNRYNDARELTKQYDHVRMNHQQFVDNDVT